MFGDDGRAVGTEEFRTAPGIAGSRWFSTIRFGDAATGAAARDREECLASYAVVPGTRVPPRARSQYGFQRIDRGLPQVRPVTGRPNSERHLEFKRTLRRALDISELSSDLFLP